MYCYQCSLSMFAWCTAGSGEACACSSDRLALARQACAELAPGGPALAAQHLFSVYTHPLPEFGQYPAGSLFAGTEIADRVEVHSPWHLHEPALS